MNSKTTCDKAPFWPFSSLRHRINNVFAHAHELLDVYYHCVFHNVGIGEDLEWVNTGRWRNYSRWTVRHAMEFTSCPTRTSLSPALTLKLSCILLVFHVFWMLKKSWLLHLKVAWDTHFIHIKLQRIEPNHYAEMCGDSAFMPSDSFFNTVCNSQDPIAAITKDTLIFLPQCLGKSSSVNYWILVLVGRELTLTKACDLIRNLYNNNHLAYYVPKYIDLSILGPTKVMCYETTQHTSSRIG